MLLTQPRGLGSCKRKSFIAIVFILDAGQSGNDYTWKRLTHPHAEKQEILHSCCHELFTKKEIRLN